MERKTRNELIRHMFALRQAEYSHCFAPGENCQRPAIRAHSVQNSRVLDLLAKDGHVSAFSLRLSPHEPPSVALTPVGRKLATTFAGLCGEHDGLLFRDIDTSAVDPANHWHLFLLAYRSVTYEVHATCSAAAMLQRAYLKRVELGLELKNVPSQASIHAVDRMSIAYTTFLYKQQFDHAYLTQTPELIVHDVLELHVRPTVAASALFSLDHLINGDDIVRVALNILPLSDTRTVAIFSYTASDATLARGDLAPLLGSSPEGLPLMLSMRLLNSCQNFVLAPAFVAGWSKEKVARVERFFLATLHENALSPTDESLMLFTAVA